MIERQQNLLDKYFEGKKPPERDFVYRPPIALVEDRLGLDTLLKAYGMKKFQIEGIPGVVICPQNYKVSEDGIEHDHGSQATYYIDGQETPDGDVVYLYTLDANTHTSQHVHEAPLSEDYFALHGRPRMENEVIVDYMYAPTNANHQVKAGDSKVLVMALLRNGASVPPRERHRYIKEAV